MPYINYAVFYTEPDTGDEIYCKACGTLCDVERSLFSPTGYVESLARRGHWHDTFRCPHSEKTWHDRALELMLTIEEIPSKRVAELMQQDLDNLLRENGCG
jgi:hypothetical protein